ncbi:hypothetical protein RIF29_29328 [Crotalaria pallida]|uniref:Uncharacterized protein n=1 Tax=Crotalaria pallida TaxID=3830 RepID=A0AAN9EGQ3_CROPI
MWHLVAAVRRNIQNMKKSSRVADENMFEAGNTGRRQHGWSSSGFSLVCAILQAPISVLSCVSHPRVNNGPDDDDYDGVWATNEFAQISEMNHLMVNDSMRYAILM